MRKLGIYGLLSLLILGAVGAEAARKPWPRRPGVVLYKMKADASPKQQAAFAKMAGARRIAAAASWSGAHRAMTWTAAGRDEEDLAQELLKTGAVDYAEPDYRMPPAALPNDPSYYSQWHHGAVHSVAAWDQTTGDRSVTVAVCDSGVDATHPDLAANMALPGYNSADGGADASPITDHGTAVAGVIGGVGNNATGVTGMAWNLKILPVRVTNYLDGSAWCSDMVAGIAWAADHGAKAINLSYDITGCPNTIDGAARYAQDRGAVVFAAAGNSGVNLSGSFPQPHTLVLVGATDASGNRPGFSNYGSPVDMTAPGVSIYSTLPGAAYGYASGTSFAAPIVTGIAALLYALNPNWTPAQVREFMASTAQAASAGAPAGQVNAGAAVTAAKNVLLGIGAAAPSAGLDAVIVFPNPWRADRHSSEPVIFDGLTAGSTVRIFTLSGFQARTLTPDSGRAIWDLKNDSGDRVASGLYMYSITDGAGRKAQGKVGVIR